MAIKADEDKKMILTPERIALIRTWAEPVAKEKTRDGKTAKHILVSLNWAERKGAI